MIIKNYDQLLADDLDELEIKLRRLALKSLVKAVEAVKPDKLIEKSIKLKHDFLYIQGEAYNLNNFNTIYIIGGGKATFDMAVALKYKFIDSNLKNNYKGLINIPDTQDVATEQLSPQIQINKSSHPIPNEKGIEGVKNMLQLLREASINDLIITLISGGGSALLPLPKEEISLDDLKQVNSLLLECGASIHEINTIRKHLSEIKGGNLAKFIQKTSDATLISLIISDVVGNNLDSIASGITVPDTTTYEDAWNILDKYGLLEKIPNSIFTLINKGRENSELETPKSGDPCFNHVHNYLIGSVKDAVDELIAHFKNQDIKVNYFSNHISGEARYFANAFYEILEEKFKKDRNHKKLALIGTGELTVT